jgi:hypothetical protein
MVDLVLMEHITLDLAFIANESWMGGHNWVIVSVLNLLGPLESEWKYFMAGVKHARISLSQEVDALVWSWNATSGKVTAKLPYGSLYFANLKDE